MSLQHLKFVFASSNIFLQTVLQNLFFKIVNKRNVPKHVVFLINDVPFFYGLNKYPNKKLLNIKFEKILDYVDWCIRLKINELSVFTFDCVTYRFPSEEISNSYMTFEKILLKWIDSTVPLLNEVCVNIVDKYGILPKRTTEIAHKIEKSTKTNTKFYLNIIIGLPAETDLIYLASVIKPASGDRHKSIIFNGNEIFNRAVIPCGKNIPELIISNCGYRRLTDYLIWKTPTTYIHHFHVSWPEFNWWKFIACILYFQNHLSNADG